MTTPERRMTKEKSNDQMTKMAATFIRHSNFVIISSFVIRHSSFHCG